MTIVIAELGANHNGDHGIAARMVRAAVAAGADAIKLQKRDLDLAIPDDQKHVKRDTPWGRMDYIDYRRHLEFGEWEWKDLDTLCTRGGVRMFGSAWDMPSVDFLMQFDPWYIKLPSAKLTDLDLIDYMVGRRGRATIIVSTGMSTQQEVNDAVERLPGGSYVLHCNSTYPAPNDELNLKVIRRFMVDYPQHRVGYSGHERGIAASVAAVALGAEMVERHFTLDRAMWGTDQAASLEPQGFARMVKDIRVVEAALGDGIKRVYPSEESARRKLRGD